ncbi:pyrroline-5-carboxylate reductase [Radiobacillus sp. PE A8.2]|uniref:pyrroline-5-carboxylate reductase n=1 Tax=Radiobacillus sp. PE A8.2 TaxID=3380349 RepID=UPI003890B25A
MLRKVAFIGAGSMAEAMIIGMKTSGLLKPEQISVTNKSNQDRLDYLNKLYHIHTSSNKQEVIDGADIVILAMKPNGVEESINEIRPYLLENQILLSVLAGVSSDFITETIGLQIPVIRVMPNTSATIGLSATTIAAGKYASPLHVKQAEQLLQTIGTTTVAPEDKIDIMTALAGSGPAYFYYAVEAMEKAAEVHNLDKHIARDLIAQTLTGVAEMLKVSEDEPAELRRKITSPNGVTQAAIEELASHNFQQALISCVNRAVERSQELGSNFTVKEK